MDGITISIAAASSDLAFPTSEPARLAMGDDRGEEGFLSSFFDLLLLDVELALEGGSIMICSTVVASDLLLLDLLEDGGLGDFEWRDLGFSTLSSSATDFLSSSSLR